jgi:hypothetical protein
MWVSAREAVRILTPVVSGDAQAKLLLRSGLAGPAFETGRGPLYDDERVVALAGRPMVDEAQLAAVCPHGLYVARLPRGATLDIRSPWSEVARQVRTAARRQRPLTPLAAAITSVRIRVSGSLPFVATFLGYVVHAAELVQLNEHGPVLEPPSEWARVVTGRRMHTARGGRPAYVWTPPLD